MCAVLDPNVIISALLSREGTPARVLRAWQEGRYELIVSLLLLAELTRALAYPKLVDRIEPAEADQVVAWLRGSATIAADPDHAPQVRSSDPGDDYLLALAESERAALVSGDSHLLALAGELPVFSAAEFMALLDTASG